MIDPNVVKSIRVSRGFTQEQMAEHCQVHLRTYATFEAGKKVSRDTLRRINNAVMRSADPFTNELPDVVGKEWFFATGTNRTDNASLPMYPLHEDNLERVAEQIQRSQVNLAYEISQSIYWPKEPPETKTHLEILERELNSLIAKPAEDNEVTTESPGFMSIVSEIEARQVRAKQFKAAFPKGLTNRIFAAFITARGEAVDKEHVRDADLSFFAMILGEESDSGWTIIFPEPGEQDVAAIEDFNERTLGQHEEVNVEG